MGLNIWEILILVVIVLILFGAGKLPSAMGDVGRGIRAFKDGLKDRDTGTGDGGPPAER